MALQPSYKHRNARIPTGTFRRKSDPDAQAALRRSEPGAERKSEPGKDGRRKSAPSYDELAWETEVSEVQTLTLPPSVPPSDVYPDIEAALIAASEQLHRIPSQPELPPIADQYRRAKA